MLEAELGSSNDVDEGLLELKVEVGLSEKFEVLDTLEIVELATSDDVDVMKEDDVNTIMDELEFDEEIGTWEEDVVLRMVEAVDTRVDEDVFVLETVGFVEVVDTEEDFVLDLNEVVVTRCMLEVEVIVLRQEQALEIFEGSLEHDRMKSSSSSKPSTRESTISSRRFSPLVKAEQNGFATGAASTIACYWT